MSPESKEAFEVLKELAEGVKNLGESLSLTNAIHQKSLQNDAFLAQGQQQLADQMHSMSISLDRLEARLAETNACVSVLVQALRGEDPSGRGGPPQPRQPLIGPWRPPPAYTTGGILGQAIGQGLEHLYRQQGGRGR